MNAIKHVLFLHNHRILKTITYQTLKIQTDKKFLEL